MQNFCSKDSETQVAMGEKLFATYITTIELRVRIWRITKVEKCQPIKNEQKTWTCHLIKERLCPPNKFKKGW